MKTLLLPLFCLFAFSLNAQKEIIVKFNPEILNKELVNDKGIRSGKLNELISTEFISDINNSTFFDIGSLNYSKITRLTMADSISYSRRGTKIYVPAFWSVFTIKLPSEVNLYEALSSLSNNKYIYYAHPNFEGEYQSVNDSLYAFQESINPVKFPLGHVNVDSAWQIETGKSFVKIGIIDSGFDTTHADLFMNNGYQYSYFQNEWWQDQRGHGTKVAGIPFAIRNNEIGIAGICSGDSSSGVSSYGLSLGYEFDVPVAAASIIEAAFSPNSPINMIPPYSPNELAEIGFGLNAINCSWSIGTNVKEEVDNQKVPDAPPVDLNNFNFPCDLCYEAMEFAYRNEMIVVAARGNVYNTINDSTVAYPATFSIEESVISVSGSGYDGHYLQPMYNGSVGEIGYGSKIGRNVDVCAPYSDTMITSLKSRGLLNNPPQNNEYIRFHGTSASAPHVTGIVGLMLSYYNSPCYSSSNLSPEDVEHILERTATDKGVSGNPPPASLVGYDSYTGHGLVNAYEALKAIEKPKYQIIHSHDSLISNVTIEKIYSDTLMQLESPYTTYGPLVNNITLDDGVYFVDIYKATIEYDHSFFTSSPTDTILDLWTRSSESEGWGFFASRADSTGPVVVQIFGQKIKPRPHAQLVGYDNSTAKLYAYYYHAKKEYYTSTLIDQWLPVDTNNIKLSYSMYSYDPNRTALYGFQCDSTNPIEISLGEEAKTFTKNSFTIFPNPSNSSFTIDASFIISSVEVFDATGKLSYHQKGINSKSINLNTGLSKGVYFVKINDSEHRSINSKIIIQ